MALKSDLLNGSEYPLSVGTTLRKAVLSIAIWQFTLSRDFPDSLWIGFTSAAARA